MAVSVRIDHLTKTFGPTRAVDDISLRIEPGELFFLLGPSGCGKTTLLRSIAGFYIPESGSIHIGDADVSRLPPHERDTGMVFQSYALWPHMTVKENVAFGLQMRRNSTSEIARKVDEVLELVRMTDRATHKPNQLSGGQQQRVALARALVIHPRCLLLDEPLSNLDAKLRLEMRTEIRRICKEAGLTAIYVTHDQKEALSIADRLAVLHDGKVKQVGPPRDVYLRPVSRFVATFIGETNLLDATVVSGSGSAVQLDTPIGRLASASVPAEGVRPGDTVMVSVRPEAIRVGVPPSDSPNAFSGSVHHTIYLGEVAQHRISLKPAQGATEDVTLRAFELNPRIVARDSAEAARIWIEPQDVVVLTS